MPDEIPFSRHHFGAEAARAAGRLRAIGAVALRALTVAGLALAVAPQSARSQQRDSTRDSTPAAVPRTRADSLVAATDSTPGQRARGRPRVRTRRPAPTAALPDSLLRPPLSPKRAFLYSLAVPGQGQTKLRRPKAAALFATVELASFAMIVKSRNDLAIARARRADSVLVRADTNVTSGAVTTVYSQDPLVARIRARRLHVEDWMATVLFNHLFSGADAFIAAQLWDLPAQVSFRAVPRGLSVVASVPW